jgi:adenine-specific DNA methylase
MSNDTYFTKPECIQSILAQGILRNAKTILDPSAGKGVIAHTIKDYGYQGYVTSLELEPEYLNDLANSNSDSVIIDSFLTHNFNERKFDLVITNPPYSKFIAFLKTSLKLIKDEGKVILLLRLSVLTGIKRGEFLEKHLPSEMYVLNKRPQFQWTPLDACPYAWLVWDKDYRSNKETVTRWIW